MTQRPKINIEPSSFRDPSGYIYYQGESVFRLVQPSYQSHLDQLRNSGLFQFLIDQHHLIPHQLVKRSEKSQTETLFEVEKLPFISYPYEWTFSQLKDAALLTLNIQKTALSYGMTLKDASAYNIQFLNHRPVFIDLLSFEKYEEGRPWVAYKQFCQHFLGPLALMSLVDYRLNQLLRIHIDGLPLDLVSTLLPKRSYLSLGLAAHIHFHARNQHTFANSSEQKSAPTGTMSKIALLGLIDNLENTIYGLRLGKSQTEWGDYYTFTNYSDEAFKQKKKLVEQFLKLAKPTTVWDIGANSGEFSRLASQQGIFTVSSDLDPLAVEKNYHFVKTQQETNLLPLIIDLTNPSPALGWANQERSSFIERGPADVVMALALVHHLAISNNVPFTYIAQFLKKIGRSLIIEFVPKADSQVQKLLSTRKDIFPNYTQEAFEQEFSRHFKIVKRIDIPNSKRTLYLMESR
jgi:cyclopropane fatty-acyl-phospholipid synthase-like methyltransferase